MKKYIILIIILLGTFSYGKAQVKSVEITRLKGMLIHAKTDTLRLQLFLALAGSYRFSKLDSALYYNAGAIALAQKINYIIAEADALSDRGSIILDSGDIPQAYIYMLQSLNVMKRANTDSDALVIHGIVENRLGNLFMELGEYNTSIQHYRKSNFYLAQSTPAGVYNGLSNIGNVYELMGKTDSAQHYQQRAYNYIKKDSAGTFFAYAETEGRLGNVERDLGHYDKAIRWYRYGSYNAQKANDLRNLSILYLNLGKLFNKMELRDSAFYYARKTLAVSRQIAMKKSVYQAAELLSGLFEGTHQPDSALFYLTMSVKIKDELFGPKISRRLQQLTLIEQQRQQQLQERNDELKYRYTIIGTAASLGVILLVAFIIWRNYRKQKHTSVLLSIQKDEIISQRDSLETTLGELRTTQTQLIQSEKMASLGVLTAGIAHEIQNPLNFVNNFSEVNLEMLDELEIELTNGNNDEVLVIIADLKQNEEKINRHGKRAGSIVKNMLEHSRSGSGIKEPTDINALADEYFHLSYHGLRAKDKSFNAELVTRFDADLPKVNVVPQDMGRVLLNLFNNAFYAVNQKAKTAGPGYKPTVEIITKLTSPLPGGELEIIVRDNGTGIAEQIKEKIMQPFFTTKPTGEGTGLGLSLTYDMVVKGHKGYIDVNTKEGEYTEFVIKLPVS